jgi:hypothetical protein
MTDLMNLPEPVESGFSLEDIIYPFVDKKREEDRIRESKTGHCPR